MVSFSLAFRRRLGALPLVLSLAGSPLAVGGCGDDTIGGSGPPGIGDSGSTSGDMITTNLVTGTIDAGPDDTEDDADSTGGSATTGSVTTGDDTTTGPDPDTGTGDSGGVVVPGQTRTDLVSSGQRMESREFSMIYTLGQPTQLQSSHNSANYHLQGGLIGANGSPP